MKAFHTITHVLVAFLSLSTVTGLLLHDTNVDKATTKAFAAAADDGAGKPGNMPHTHGERSSLYQSIRDLNASQPRTQPRSQEDRRYLGARPSLGGSGTHPFGDVFLPLV